MEKLFNKILVPVDFSDTTINTIERAVDIAQQYRCSIHLLHVITISHFVVPVRAENEMALPEEAVDNMSELEFQMNRLISHIRTLSGNAIPADYSIIRGKWNEWIIELVKHNGYDLVLIGQNEKVGTNRKMLLNPDKIAARTDIPVITIPPDRRLSKIYSILIPVTNFLPVRKLMYGVYIAARNRASVKLLGIEAERVKSKIPYFLKKSYQLIHDSSAVYVGMELTDSHNVAEAVNKYALRESADLVIVNPGMQTKMPGFFSSLSGDIIQKHTISPVLTINPI